MLHPELTARLRVTLSSGSIVAQRPGLCPELQLYLIDPDFPRGPLTPQEHRAVWEKTAYWGFCWPAGQVLARRILDHPELVRGRRVVDLGCGSGVVGIAAARAGALHVLACDQDEDALQAARCNAALNAVDLEFSGQWDPSEPVDLVVLADVLYDPANYPLLDWCKERTHAILVADCRVASAPAGWRDRGKMESNVVPDLDWHDEFRTVQVFSWPGPLGAAGGGGGSPDSVASL